MSIEAGSREIQVSIAYDDGTNPLDVTPLLANFTVNDSQLDDSGLIKTTGTLELYAFPVVPFPESTNPLTNPRRWARGNQVIVQVADEDGDLVAHPRGRLRILKPPARPYAGRPGLTLEIGCLLSLQDFRQPPGDASGIELGQTTDRRTIINRLAAEAKLPNLVDAIAEFPLDYPLARLSGSWVEQMGQLAGDAGYVLWIDKLEQLRATKLLLEQTTPDLVLTLGVDDGVFEPLEPSETPCEKLRVTGTRPEVKEATDPAPEYAESRTDEYSPAETSQSFFFDMASTTPTIQRTVRRAKGLVFPDDFPDVPTLTTALEELTIDYYNDGEDGLLIRKYSRNRQPRGTVLPDDYPGDTSMMVSSETWIEYLYVNEVTIKTVTRVYEPFKVVYPEKDGSGDALSSLTIELWTKVNNAWKKSQTLSSFKAGTPSSASTSISPTNNQPPSPERRQQEKYGEEKQLTGEVSLPSFAGSSYYERDREFSIETPVDEEHLKYLARLRGGILWGQQARINWGLELRDVFLTNYRPQMVLDWIETIDGSLVKSRYLTTGIAFSHVKDRCAVAGDGINLGLVSTIGETSYLTPPYNYAVDFTGDFVLEGSFTPESEATVTLLDFDWILVDADGDVLTDDGAVLSSEGDFSAVLVNADGDVLTEDGKVLTTDDNADWDSILVDGDGNVLTDNGYVLTNTE